MSEPTVTDHLNAIVAAQPHGAFGPQIASEVHNMSELAKYLLTLKPEELLRNGEPPQGGPNNYALPAIDSWTFPQWTGFARAVTQSLRTAVAQIATMPGTGQDLQNRQRSFKYFAALFVYGWNYLIPTMQALVGPDTTTQIANAQAELQKARDDAQNIVSGMRDASGQVGLSHESTHFRAAAEKYESGAIRWLVATVILAAILLVEAATALFASKWACLTPANQYESVQLVTGKILIFAVLSYGVLLCARSYFANRHNAVVNRHRQDALLTYQAIVEAAKDTTNRDVVLQQAAICIFGPQTTGFTKDAISEAPSAKSIVELLGPMTKT